MANYINHINIGNSDYLIKDTTHPEIKFYYPTGTAAVTTSPYYCARYDVTDAEVTAYADGMMVWFEVPVVGNNTYGTGLQINSLGYKPIVCDTNTPIGSRYSVGSRIWCIYNSTQTATLYINSATSTTVTGCWQVMDYSAEGLPEADPDTDNMKILKWLVGGSTPDSASGDVQGPAWTKAIYAQERKQSGNIGTVSIITGNTTDSASAGGYVGMYYMRGNHNGVTTVILLSPHYGQAGTRATTTYRFTPNTPESTAYVISSDVTTHTSGNIAVFNGAASVTEGISASTIEQNTNKVTTISASSTDTQYPTALAVYNALQSAGTSVVIREWSDS